MDLLIRQYPNALELITAWFGKTKECGLYAEHKYDDFLMHHTFNIYFYFF